MSQVKADDYVNSAGTGAPKFSKGIDLSQAAGYNKYATVAKSADYTVTTTDGVETILVTAASNVTITLPAASGSTGRRLTFKKVDSGSGWVAIVRAGSDTIDGAIKNLLHKQYSFVVIVSDGTSWHVIDCFDYKSGSSSSTTNSANTYIDQASTTIPAGAWSVGWMAGVNKGGASLSYFACAIATVSGDTTGGTDFTTGDFTYIGASAGGLSDIGVTLKKIITVNTETIYYFKTRANATGNVTYLGGYWHIQRLG